MILSYELTEKLYKRINEIMVGNEYSSKERKLKAIAVTIDLYRAGAMTIGMDQDGTRYAERTNGAVNKYHCDTCGQEWDISPEHFDNDDCIFSGTKSVPDCEICRGWAE